MDCRKYQFWRAVRPFSFTVALCTCLTGIAAAWAAGFVDSERAILVLVGGVLLQAGVNLINDYADLTQLRSDNGTGYLAMQLIRRNFQAGLSCFALAAVLALYLIAQVGLPLLWLCLVGLAGALSYTLDPVNYKNRGLGVVLVFWLMGVLMISGTYLVIAGSFSLAVVWQSVPLSLLVSLLLLSNELRDYEADQRDGIGTLSGRIGYRRACQLYVVLLLAAYASAALLWHYGLLPQCWPLLLTLPALVSPLKLLRAEAQPRVKLTPHTGRLLTLFGLVYCYCLVAAVPGVPSWTPVWPVSG